MFCSNYQKKAPFRDSMPAEWLPFRDSATESQDKTYDSSEYKYIFALCGSGNNGLVRDNKDISPQKTATNPVQASNLYRTKS